MCPPSGRKMVPKCVTVVTFGGSEVKIAGRNPGPILLPSVAPEGTPPAMLLKKLAFGKNSPEGPRFEPQNGPQNVGFSLQIIAFSEQTGFQKTNPKK